MKKRILALSTTAALLSTVFASPALASAYTVKKGDTIAKIAKKYKLTIQTLKKLNHLNSDTIKINQKLVTSASVGQASVSINQTKTKTYTIVAGDTLTKIANKHNLTLAELQKLNPKLTTTILVGNTLVVSKTASKTVIDLPSSTKETKKATPSSNTYIVIKGDSLSKIAMKTNTTIASLKALNQLTSETIKVGQTLKIENSTSGKVTSTVASVEATDSNTDAQIENMIAEAKKVIGTPYDWAGSTPSGFDCSGFVYYAFKQAGYEISRHSASTYYSLGKSISSPQAGDLVFFAIGSNRAFIDHMGIYLGNDQFIHSSSSKGVQISSVTSSYYQSHLVGYKRLTF